MQNWLKETARDLIALSSLPFYLIVIVRVAIAEYKIYTYQLAIALIIIYFIFAFFRQFNLYASSFIPLLIFTNIFYENTRYLMFSTILALLLVTSLFSLFKKKEIFLGVLIGTLSTGAAYSLAPLITQ